MKTKGHDRDFEVKVDEAILARLMAEAQTGNKESYRVLLSEARHWLQRYFCRRISLHALEDLVQETLISMHTKRASYDPSRPFIPWMAAIARYRWVDHLRRLYRAGEVALVSEIGVGSGESALVAQLSLERLFRHLPEGQARVIRLVRIEGRSIAEAALVTGQSETLVKVNVHRGLKRLAAIVERD